MRIALYQGKSFISRAIRWQTRSKYSHAAFLLDDGSVIEAWTDGVRKIDPQWHLCNPLVGFDRIYDLSVEKYPALSKQHSPGTKVDIFAFCKPLTETENHSLKSAANFMVGTPYDYLGIICFLTREKDPSRRKVFCSELVFGKCAKVGRLLLQRISPSCVSPGMIALSPDIFLEESIETV